MGPFDHFFFFSTPRFNHSPLPVFISLHTPTLATPSLATSSAHSNPLTAVQACLPTNHDGSQPPASPSSPLSPITSDAQLLAPWAWTRKVLAIDPSIATTAVATTTTITTSGLLALIVLWCPRKAHSRSCQWILRKLIPEERGGDVGSAQRCVPNPHAIGNLASKTHMPTEHILFFSFLSSLIAPQQTTFTFSHELKYRSQQGQRHPASPPLPQGQRIREPMAKLPQTRTTLDSEHVSL